MIRKRTGFTIIEVMIVMAVAGLLFGVVFIANQQLKRSERNTKRKNMVHAMAVALEEYYTNNKCYPQLPPAGPNRGTALVDLLLVWGASKGCEVSYKNLSDYLPPQYSRASTNVNDNPNEGYETNGMVDPLGGSQLWRECYLSLDKTSYLLWYIPEPQSPNICTFNSSTNPPSVPGGAVQVKI